MGQGVSDAPDPMASQMAQLLAGSDLDELREIVRRWAADAPTEGARRQYQEFGGRLLDLKAALAEGPAQPTVAELEQAITVMLRLAASSPRR